jgi:FHA domain-containing protein
MGVIRELDTGRDFPLAARSLVGRASQCHIRLDACFVSREHASVEYIDGRYYIKDLSSNGIEVGGRLVERGELTALKPGVQVALGHGVGAPRLELCEDRPPQLVAHELDSRRVIGVPRGSVLRLSGEPQPDAVESGCVEIGYDDQLGAFMFMNAASDSVSPIRNEQILRVGSSLWMIHLPSDDSRTSSSNDFPVDLRHATLKLITDESLEMVEVRVLPHSGDAQAIRAAERTIVSRSRYAETLLALAIKKRDDLVAGVPEHKAGWLTNDALLGLVGSPPGADGNLPYLHPFRLKRLFEAANVRSLSVLFQRENGALRLGMNDFEVIVREDALETSQQSSRGR